MKKSQLFISLLLLIILITACCEKKEDLRIKEAREVITGLLNNQHIAGFSITVIKDGELIWSEGFGYADLENKTQVDPEKSMFRIGSVSKMITAIGAAKLYQNGQLNLKANVRKYVPYFPEKKYPFTVEQVASHMSGIRHYSGDPKEYYNKRRYTSVKQSLEVFMNDSLQFKPGDRYLYSSFGYNTMSAIIEGASGQTYIEYLSDAIFNPLGMNHTTFDYSDSIIIGRTGHYEFDSASNKIINAEFVDNSYKWAGGGLLSSSFDLANLAWAWHSNQIVTDSIKQLFITNKRLNNGEPTNYGFGWAIYSDLDIPSYGHGGTAVGGKGTVRVFPDYDMVIGITINNWKVGYRDELNEIVKLFIQ